MPAVMDREQTAVRSGAGRRWRWFALALVVSAVALGYVLYVTVPKGNVGNGPVRVLVVLGTPAGMHGELTEMQRWRVDEGVREYWRGRAPYLLFTGGPTFRGYVEADVMAAYAMQQGVPAGAILRDRRAMTTIENITNATQILHAHGWHTVEVISTAQHLPRAAVLLSKTDLRWRTDVAPTPDRGWADNTVSWVEEAVGTAALRMFGPRAEPVLHTLARGQHGLAYSVRWVLYWIQDHT